MQLRYFVPFKAQEGVDSQYALKEKLLNIEGVAVDSSVNLNKWQVPEEDLDFFVSTLIGAQLRIDHAESAMAVIGKVPEGKRLGSTVQFRAEIGDEAIIEKVIRGYLTHVSVQVDSDDVECSKCKRPTRKEGVLVHLCPGAWEIVHKPKVRELSIVASPAYKNTTFAPLGFAAAMNEDQWGAVLSRVQDSTDSRLLNGNKDVGSKGDLQEPENKTDETKKLREVKHLSEQQTAQQEASPHTAQAVNVGPGETAPKQVDYGPFLKQLQDLKQQIYQAEGDAIDSEIDTLKKRVAEMEAELAKKATKRQLSKKLSELAKRAEAEESEEGEEGEEGTEGGPKPTGPIDVVSKRKKGEEAEAEEAEAQEAEASRSSKTPYGAGKGIVAVDEVQKDALGGPDYGWFRDARARQAEGQQSDGHKRSHRRRRDPDGLHALHLCQRNSFL
jgi:hypothetical protein